MIIMSEAGADAGMERRRHWEAKSAGQRGRGAAPAGSDKE